MKSERTAQLRDANLAVEFYDARYRSGYMDEWPPEKKQRVFDLLRDLGLPAQGEALDFGCGNGVFTEVLRLALPKWRIYGTDFSEVALEHARARYPAISFFPLTPNEVAARRFDLVFTHHVLEHVSDLDEAWGQITGLMKPGASALHILPCGNQGSFEHHICTLRRNGIERELQGRFFLDEEAHVRRLDTQHMIELANRAQLELVGERYANQYYGAVKWITTEGLGFVRFLTDPAFAVDERSKAELRAIRRKLTAITVARNLAARVKRAAAARHKTLRNWAGLALCAPLFPICQLIDWHTRRSAAIEWQSRQRERGGSEMYLHFRLAPSHGHAR